MKQQEVHLKQQVSLHWWSHFFFFSPRTRWTRKRLCFSSSCRCTQRSLKSFRRRCPRATRCSPPLNRRWRRWVCPREGKNSANLGSTRRFCFWSRWQRRSRSWRRRQPCIDHGGRAATKLFRRWHRRCALAVNWSLQQLGEVINENVPCPFPAQKSVRDRDFEALQGKVQRLERLRRALKVERNELNKKVRSLSSTPDEGAAETPVSGNDSPSPPPTDSPLDPSGPPVPDTAPCSQSGHCDQQLDTETVLEGAAGPPVSTQEWRVFCLVSSVAPPASKILFLC